MKGCSAPLIVKGIQMKSIMRYHYIPGRMAVIKETDNTKYIHMDLKKLECRSCHLHTDISVHVCVTFHIILEYS